MRKIIFLLIFLSCLIYSCVAQSEELALSQASIEKQAKMESKTAFTQIGQSKYFNIYSQQETELLKLIRRLDLRSEYLLMKGASSEQQQMRDMLGAIVDAIFLEACDVLHMYLYSFKGNIKICQDQEVLNEVFRDFFDRDLNTRSFYIHNKNSIYINIRNTQLEDLAYDVARAIISHYFSVLPPIEVQETLAKDAGYQIKKLAK